MADSFFKAARNRFRDIIGPSAYEMLRYRYYQIFVPNAGYSRHYYLGCDAANQDYYEPFARSVIREFQPKTVADIGCGSSGMGLAFKRLGCEVFPFDGSADAVRLAKDKGLTAAQQIDLTTAPEIPAKTDVCLCLELAEHLPEKFAPHLCALLAKVAPVLVFTAAPPTQGGHLHVNLKEHSYWIDLMKQHGLIYDAAAVEAIRAGFGIVMLQDYDANLMIFRRAVT